MSKPIGKTVGAGLVVLLSAGAFTAATPAAAAPVLYEAESATIINGAVEGDHGGFSGSGFVNSANAVGAAIEFSVTMNSAGSKSLSFRYANGTTSNRPAALTVNGDNHSTLSFPGSGSWTNWTAQTATANLIAGTNTVRITSTTSFGLANIDSLTVDDGQSGGGGPISNPIPQNPIQSGLGLILTEWAQFPQSTPVPSPTDSRLRRHARINYLGQLPDGSGRRFVPDLNGKLYFVAADGGTPRTYLDVRQTVGSNFFSGRGLGSGFGFAAFHPEFGTNGRFYTVHSEAFNALSSTRPDWTQSGAQVHSVLTEWTASNPSAGTFSGSHRTLMRIGFSGVIHAVQQIDFNPNATPGSADYGLLYIAVGDGGAGASGTIPQNRAMPHGKILRIDPRGNNSANRNYGIPPTNPFVGQSGTLGEIYAIGMRDPHRFSWDRGGTRRMFMGHIGEHDIEAIYDVRPGDNFGWSEREGMWVFNKSERCNLYPLPSNDSQYGYDYPVAAYDHDPPPGTSCTADVGRAVVGGFVYRGSAFPSLTGKYVFGDLVQGWIFYTNESQMVRGSMSLAPLYRLNLYNSSNQPVTMASLAGDNRIDLRFGIDAAGDLYLMAKANGKIWKVTGVRGTAP